MTVYISASDVDENVVNLHNCRIVEYGYDYMTVEGSEDDILSLLSSNYGVDGIDAVYWRD